MKRSIVAIIVTILSLAPSIGSAQDSTKQDGLQITDAKLGSDVKDRMVVGEGTTFPKNSKVFLWMKLTGGNSEQITVTWKTGNYSHSTTLLIGGSPWRTWASKTVGRAGDWTVSVTDAQANSLKEMSFKVE